MATKDFWGSISNSSITKCLALFMTHVDLNSINKHYRHIFSYFRSLIGPKFKMAANLFFSGWSFNTSTTNSLALIMAHFDLNSIENWIISINNVCIVDITLLLVIAQWDPFDRFDMNRTIFWNTRHSCWHEAMPLS